MLTKQTIKDKQATIGVIGLGYVGLPLAVEFAKAGFNVIGLDYDETKIENIKNQKNYIKDVHDKEYQDVIAKKMLKAFSDPKKLNICDIFIVCVPTPLNKIWEPDMSYIMSAVNDIVKNMKEGVLIILESTTYPGTTDEVVLTALEQNNKVLGKDFCLAFSPERVDPGNPKYKTKDIPKIVGGIDKKSTELASALYDNVVVKTVPVSSARVAEMAKVLENTFRSVNIAIINEISMLCNKMGIDVWEVIDAASTKPFGFMPFYPGPGLGGHCLPIDPMYLAWKAKFHDFNTRFIHLANEINKEMPAFVVEKITDILNSQKKSINGSAVLILGVAYKSDVDDLRESPALTIIEILKHKGAEVFYSDPYIPEIKMDHIKFKSVSLNAEKLKEFDCAVIVTNHKKFDYQMIVNNSKIVLDTRNAAKHVVDNKEKVVKL